MSSTDRRAPGARACALLGAAAVALALAGCAHAPKPTSNGLARAAINPLEQYPARAVEQPEQVMLSVHPGGALSAAQEQALAGFAQTWREGGTGARIVVQSPSTAGPDGALSAHAAAGRLAALGVPPASITVADYDAGSQAGAPVIARYDRLAAEAPDCAKGWDNLVATNSNSVSTHFGCANARNFAVMLADPRDLNGPRAVTPADAGRRANVLDKYRQGQLTASAKDDQASGAVSQKVK